MLVGFINNVLLEFGRFEINENVARPWHLEMHIYHKAISRIMFHCNR
jgi:hypothetical protein